MLEVLLYPKENQKKFSQIDNSFKALYDCNDHLPVFSSVEIDYQQEQRPKKTLLPFHQSRL